jgi:hypothetical protein
MRRNKSSCLGAGAACYVTKVDISYFNRNLATLSFKHGLRTAAGIGPLLQPERRWFW